MDQFKYLGSTAAHTAEQDQEINRRLALAAAAYRQLQPRVFSSRHVWLRVKVMAYKTIVLPILLFGAAESWALSVAQANRLRVFHTTCIRRMLGISRLDMVSNASLFERTGLVDLGLVLRQHRLRFLGHVGRMPLERWPKMMLFASEVPGLSRPAGRPALTWPHAADSDLSEAAISAWFEKCQDRAQWRTLIGIK